MQESALPSPCYLMDQAKLKSNLMLLDELRRRTCCHILFAQKAFSSYPFYSMMARYLDGASACSAYEAQLAHLFFRGENHVFQTAYLPEEIGELVKICDHIVFNSPSQLMRYGNLARENGCAVGLRINSPEQIRQVKEAIPDLPIIGLYKVWHDDTDVFITPTMKEVDAIVVGVMNTSVSSCHTL